MTKLPTKAILSLIAALFFCMGIHAQNIGDLKIEKKKKSRWGNYILTGGLAFTSGAIDGFNQALSFHYWKVDEKLHLPDSYWNPEISWKNKYKEGNPENGPKFPGSNTIFVFLSDGYHLTRFGSHLFNAGAIALKITGDRKRWYWYVVDMAYFWAMNRLGFQATYYRF